MSIKHKYNDMLEVTINLRDPDNQLILLIDYINRLSGPGHSFDVVVDPDMRENRKSFFIDGDGAFYIKDLKMNGKKIKIENDKLIEGYLKTIQ